MKKTLLVCLLTVPTMLFAQTQQLTTMSNAQALPVVDVPADDIDLSNDGTPTAPTVSDLKMKAQPYEFIQIGQTYYDLQSNNSLGNRIILHSDGSVSAVWTTSPDNNSTTFPNRGAGYNYSDGTDWGSVLNTRLEDSRTGWPSIGLLGNGNVYVIAHDASNGGFRFTTGPKDGSNWAQGGPILDDQSSPGQNRAPIWAKTASSGDYLYMVCTYTSSGNNSTVTINGVDNPILFSRSKDNGATWVEEHVLLPGYDSTLYLYGSAEIYDITARDSVVAIVIGSIGQPITMWKSTDWGENFTLYDVDNHPYPGVSIDQWPVGDTLNTCDGSLEIILDNDLNAHVFFGGTITFKTVQNGDTGSFYIPAMFRIMHWTEGMLEPQFCAGALDRDGDGSYNITPETYNFLDANGFVPSTLLTVARYGNNAIATMPSASVAANGDIYLVYSLAIEETYSFLQANFRDVMVTYSTDGGQNWATPQNITQDDDNEHVFCFAAERADDYLHLMWQKDDIPGTNLQNNDATASNHLVTDNKILYGAIPLSAIKNGEIGPHTTGVEELNKPAEVFVVGQPYPNPTSGYTQVTIFLLNAAQVDVQVTDMYGNVVNNGSAGILNAGNHVIDIDASQLASGMYFYTISTSDHSVTKKIQVN